MTKKEILDKINTLMNYHNNLITNYGELANKELDRNPKYTHSYVYYSNMSQLNSGYWQGVRDIKRFILSND
jgi:hypothetical protein